MTTSQLRTVFKATRDLLDVIEVALKRNQLDPDAAAIVIRQQQTLIRNMLRAGDALADQFDEVNERVNRLEATMRARRAAHLN